MRDHWRLDGRKLLEIVLKYLWAAALLIVNGVKYFVILVYEAVMGVFQNYGALHAAALSYNTLFSFAPLVILIVVITTRAFQNFVLEEEVMQGIEALVGIEAAPIFEEFVASSYNVAVSRVWTTIGILFLIYAASSLFMQLRVSLNAMWGLTIKKASFKISLRNTIYSRLLSATWVLVLGLLLPVILGLNVIWAVIAETVHIESIDEVEAVLPFIELVTSPVLIFVTFALLFKSLPQAKIHWRDVFPGAFLTSVLFWLGTSLVGNYLKPSAIASVYGAAASLIFFLLWVYYSAWTILIGARFTMLYANRIGKKIIPYEHMKIL